MTFSYARVKPNEPGVWRTETINSFGLIGPEDFLEETILNIRNELFQNLSITVVVSVAINGSLLAVIVMM